MTVRGTGLHQFLTTNERHDMAAQITDPKTIEHAPYDVIGIYAVYEGDDEGPGWGKAWTEFSRRKHEVQNREGDTLCGFLYRPHRDDPSIPEAARACFIGVEVSSADDIPEGMTLTHFSGGRYITTESRGDTEGEAAMGVGDAVQLLETWIDEHGYVEGDACFCFSHEDAETPPFVQHVHANFVEQ
jgi:predicted transcriptional regulator YdeE